MSEQANLFDEVPDEGNNGGGNGGDSESLTLATFAERAYLDYAISVVKGRALPDVSDGQKPVQRRILYSMNELGLNSSAKPRKSATVVGDVLGKLHPHGDQSVYDAMVRMAQDFSLRYPLIDGQGNFGSRDGDGAAAMVIVPAEKVVRKPRVVVSASAASTDTIAVHSRKDPLFLQAAYASSKRAYEMAGITPNDIDVFELHDAFSIMAALSLEASGFAERGQGVRLALDN
ncbi:MAG: hypothetical protein HYR92_06525, partial [Burkholderiales bacterium]|nr:hypothetical protein [Burkholderiales bacterium]